MKKIIAMILILIMVLSLTACGSSAPAGDPKVIKIGMSGPLTGDAAVYGIAVKGGIEIAVEEINAAAGDGLKLEFQAQDDEADGEKAVNAYNKLMDWGMQIMAGPTTSGRMDAYAPTLISLGQTAMIGKGERSIDVIDAMVKHGAVYFGAIGGAGALIAKSVKSAEVVAYDDLGTEAIRKLEVENLPVIVVIDSNGNNLYETAIASYKEI